MNILQSILLGLVQGLTEFLPISSSGHLVIFQEIFHISGESNDLLLEVLLHLGTLLAVFIVFWKDIVRLIVEFFKLIGSIFTGKCRWREMPPHRKMVILILIATAPLFVVALLKDKLAAAYNSLWVVGICLLITGALLWLSDRFATGKKTMDTAKPLDALTVGAFQAVAVLPGISRSGSTIIGGLFCGFDREFAVKFSFILSIPAILGANILEVSDALSAGIDTSMLLPYVCGILAALLSGLAAIRLLQLIMRKHCFSLFAWYCGVVGLLVLAYCIFVR